LLSSDTTFVTDTIPPPAPVKEVKHFAVDTKLSGTIDVYAVPTFVWEAPVAEVVGNPWHLYYKEDTLWKVVKEFELETDEFNPRKQYLYADWDYEMEYKLDLDSGAVRSIYDSLTNNKLSKVFKIKAEKEYSRLTVTIPDLGDMPAFVEVLDKNDKVIRREEVVNGVADCLSMKPGECYLRLILDENDNFIWDPGCYEEKRQPEKVFYLSKKLNLRANWEINETWRIYDLPIDQQKPKELKPAEKSSTRK